ncbi:MAG: DNA repair exonuclease [Deltaproteobacteria bacterium]|nr:DNA repair exonuclease [Deltaproteobacteria bacterium]
MIKFLHTADIHLDSPLKGLESHDDAPLEEIRGATRRAFDNLIELALEQEVRFMLIAGDLFDGDWKDYNTGLFFAKHMGRLAQAGIRVFIVSGNHDAASQMTKSIPWPKNVNIFSARKAETVKLEELRIAIHGQSYASRAATGNLTENFPQYAPGYFNIGLLHTSLTGREGHENYAPCTVADLTAKGYDYWALGHIHKREIVCENPAIIFPGNLQGRHSRETGTKGATLVSVTEGCITEIEECPLDVLRWSVCPVDLSPCANTAEVYEEVHAAIQKEQNRNKGKTLALRLQLEGRCPVHNELKARSRQITEELRGLAAGLGEIWLEKIIFRTTPQTDQAQMTTAESPFFNLLQAVAGLDFDEERLTAFVPELASLKSRLPAELSDGAFLAADKSENLQDLLTEVKDLLIARLHEGE